MRPCLVTRLHMCPRFVNRISLRTRLSLMPRPQIVMMTRRIQRPRLRMLVARLRRLLNRRRQQLLVYRHGTLRVGQCGLSHKRIASCPPLVLRAWTAYVHQKCSHR